MQQSEQQNSSITTLSAVHWTLGDWLIDADGNGLYRAGENYLIEPKAMAVLVYLAEHKGRTVSIQELLEQVWEGSVVSENTVRRILTQLRKVLQDDATNPQYIATIPRKGYRVIADVQIKPPSRTWRKPFLQAGLAGILLIAVSSIGWLTEPSNDSGAIPLLPITTLPGRELTPTFSPDGKAFVYAHAEENSPHYQLNIQWLESGKRSVIKDVVGNPFAPVWSPDGRYLAYADIQNYQIMVAQWQPDGLSLKTPQSIYAFQPDNFPQLAWSKDSRSLFFNDVDSSRWFYQQFQYYLNTASLELIDLKPPESKQGIIKILPHPNEDNWAVVSLDGNNSTHTWLYSPTVGNFTKVYDAPEFNPHLTWCGSQKKYLLLGGKQQLLKLEAQNHNHKVLKQNADGFHYPTCSASDSKVLFASRWRNHSLINQPNPLTNSDLSTQPQFLYRSTQTERHPVWKNTEKLLTFTSNRKGYWQLWQGEGVDEARQPELLSDQTFETRPQLIGWSPDDSQLLLTHLGKVWIFSAQENIFRTIELKINAPLALSWSANGKMIYYVDATKGTLYQTELKTGTTEVIGGNAGHALAASQDGEHIYLSKQEHKGLWKIHLSSKTESLIFKDFPAGSQLQVFEKGIYFHHHDKPAPGLYFYNFTSETIQPVLNQYNDQGHEFAISSDEKEITYITWDKYHSDLKLLHLQE
ncbi:winged helix-turn-helix domain-containing protein [Pleionea sp. CnH1-48]|uniref:winged helix-turn-helix domain-containing protein n=1 Tax=Pleionea sp. CnH1-48 TaxID=2954494 RepID=UPI002096F169|nr:winged helix-turn-helix domain-containing protein [Pleionea sp. CnH1-48]MCO7226577.1 winged helix-turn-helix domain-containing protein [Pleionea sp. CnH1-48]